MAGTLLPYSSLGSASSSALLAATAGARVRTLGGRETTGSAGAVLIFHHGTDATGPAIFSCSLAPGQSRLEGLPEPVDCSSGIYVERVSGSSDAFAHVRAGYPSTY